TVPDSRLRASRVSTRSPMALRRGDLATDKAGRPGVRERRYDRINIMNSFVMRSAIRRRRPTRRADIASGRCRAGEGAHLAVRTAPAAWSEMLLQTCC